MIYIWIILGIWLLVALFFMWMALRNPYYDECEDEDNDNDEWDLFVTDKSERGESKKL